MLNRRPVKTMAILSLILTLMLGMIPWNPLAPSRVYGRPIQNNYIALGDSITYGMSADPGKGYVDLFASYLNTTTSQSITYANLGTPGDRTNHLLSKLQQDPATQLSVSQAEVITLNIGGNNLLNPLITTIATAFGLNPQSPTFASELAVQINNPLNQTTLNAAITGLQPQFVNGVQQFAQDFPQIIGTIKLLAPQATLYVATLYNPLNPQDPFYPLFETPLQMINSIILTPEAGYKVADAYTLFRLDNGISPLTGFSLLSGNVDPHPTNRGHELIYQAHLQAREIRNARPPLILSHPSDLYTNIGGIAELSVLAGTTSGALSYQWYSATTGSGITTSGPITTSASIILGATGSMYSAPTTTAGIGYYFCVVTNTDTTALGSTTASAISRVARVSVYPDSPNLSSPTYYVASSYGGGSASAERTAAVVFQDLTGSQQPPANLIINRETTNGSITDRVTFTEDKALETVHQALLMRMNKAIIQVVDLPQQKADKVEVELLRESLEQLAHNGMAISIITDKVKIELPKETVASMKDQDNTLDIAEQKDQNRIGQTQGLMLSLVKGSKLLSTPLVIDSNITSGVWLTLPLNKTLIPDKARDWETFVRNLAVLIERRDGDNKIDKGRITYDNDGKPTGISVYVDKFSTFTVIGLPEKTRFAGADRIKTAEAISQAGWPGGAKAVILANGYDFADALSATALGGLVGGPLLLTAGTDLTPTTLQEIIRLDAKEVYIVGGAAAVPLSIEEQLKNKGYSVYRLSGADRFATAVAVGNHIIKSKGTSQPVDTVLLAYGYDFADALSGATFAAKHRYPLT